MTTLLIARHGNTFAPGDVVTRVGARTDLPLVESGLEQGRRLGRYLRERQLLPTAIFTSELQRTRQMAELVLAELDLQAPLIPLSIFNEIDYGPDENRPETEVVARLGAAALAAWDAAVVVPPGWQVDPEGIRQAWVEFAGRVVSEFKGKTVLVVTSNGIARFAPAILTTPQPAGLKLKIATGALCRLDHDGAQWSITDWNVRP